ncbi:MAG: hypothetical protein KC502_10860 [Myxococcales bacterium]|nr:hypothetical protein [Myxococcales bacterium]
MRPVVIVVAIAFALMSCGETKVICPVGFHAEGTFCYPDEAVPTDTGAGVLDTGAASDAAVDSGPAVKDTAATDTGKADSGHADTGAPDTGPQDSGPKDTGPPKSPVGAACVDDLDCFAGLSCFTYPKGYCTLLNCSPSTSCPGSAVCWGKDKQSQICNADCDGDGDCRTADGYGCKRLSSKFGGIDANLCLPGGNAKHGQLCTGPLDCEGSDTCLTDMSGGYCARTGCSVADPCPSGTNCVLREGKPTCLKSCTTDVTCQVTGKHPRKCVQRTDLGKKLVKICLDSDKASPIGAQCGADLDCDSGLCTIVSKGTCKTGDAPCLADAQCGANGPCVLDAKKEKGICSQGCANDKGCPSSSVCVPSTASALSGACQPTCQGPGDTASCKTPGTECIFGQPIAPPGGIALPGHACGFRPKGAPGAGCTALSDCDSKDCTVNAQGTAGYCSAACGAGKPPCPFGTKCISSGLSFCERLCNAAYDCPAQMDCKTSAQPGVKTCQLP